MKTYEERKAELKITIKNFHYYVGQWRGSNKSKVAMNMFTGEVFHGNLDELLIEKRIIDMLDPVF